MRRRAARPVLSGGDERLLDAAAASVAVPDPSADTDLSLDVMAALRILPHDQQVALVLVDMLGYPVADAAEVLSVSQGTVKSRCARGRARLLPRLAHLRRSDKTGRPDAPVQPGLSGRTDSSAQIMRNRSATESVLPAQEGGDETR
jgi:RNA polymerase sigma-70 factor (ECF subfamily)